MDLIDWENRELPITIQAERLGLNRTGLYYKPLSPSDEEIVIKHRIDEIYTAYPFYGSRRIAAQLKREGFEVGRKRVQTHVREMGISGIIPVPNLSKRRFEHQVYPYLLKNLAITRPNHVWGIDITYIRMDKGWLYLVAILDWFSRFVLSWELDQALEMPFVLEAVKRALGHAHPEILNSDPGSHFTSPQYMEILKGADVKISMDGRGRALDNIFTERLWRSLKYEEVTSMIIKVQDRPGKISLNTWIFIITYGCTSHWITAHQRKCILHERGY